MSNAHNIREKVKDADLLIGAVLIEGARAPYVVTKDMVQTMKTGAVIIDVAIDQEDALRPANPLPIAILFTRNMTLSITV